MPQTYRPISAPETQFPRTVILPTEWAKKRLNGNAVFLSANGYASAARTQVEARPSLLYTASSAIPCHCHQAGVAIGSNILGVAAVSLFPSGGHTVVVGISEGGGGQPTRPRGESRNDAQKRSGFMPVLASGKLSSRQAGNFWLPIFVLNNYTVALALKSGWHFCILSVFLAYIALCVYSFLHQLSLFCAALKWQ